MIIKKYRVLGWVLAMGLLAGCAKHESKQSSESKIPEIQTVAISSLQPSRLIKLPGELKPWNKVGISAKVKGYVGKVLVDRGDQVNAGQLMARLEAPEVVAQLGNAEAKVSETEAKLIEQQARSRASRLTYKRLKETSQTKGAVSANELDMAYARMMSDSALTTSAKGALQAAKALLTSHRQLVDYLSVKAPFDGIVTERNISPGALVGPAEGNGLPMYVVEDRSKLRLTVPVPEVYTNSIQDSSKVTFTVNADPGKVFKAIFGRSASSLQELNRTMMTEFDVDNSNAKLKAGMYAEVTLPIQRNDESLFVPSSALVHSSEGVYVIRVKENIADWIEVRKGNKVDTLVEVFGPVKAGELIMRNANPEVRNGQKVEIAMK